MATVRKHGAKWQVIIRKRNHVPVYKCFISKAVATNWAQETELKIEQGVRLDYWLMLAETSAFFGVVN